MNRVQVYIDWLRKDWSKQMIRILKRTLPNYDLIKLSIQSLFYNEHLNRDYVIDILLEPMFWFVDNFTNTLGPIFVFLVVVLISLYVLIAYIIGLPFYLVKSVPIAIVALIIGNYLLANAIFHYFMAWKTDPGCLPSDVFIKNSVSICKKCILPKPPRTHHCSACDRCILKMDHHCPWLNNCIGHFNHRYFFMFSMFAWLGTIFVIVFGLPIALNHYFNIDVFSDRIQLSDLFNLNNYLNASTRLDPLIVELDGCMQSKYFDAFNIDYLNLKNNCIIFDLLLTVSAFVAIGGLMGWHAKMITNGETCIESLRNKKERRRLAGSRERFYNPFDKGKRRNWMRFFGLEQEGIGLRHVLLPSTHKPSGDGIDWNLFYD